MKIFVIKKRKKGKIGKGKIRKGNKEKEKRKLNEERKK